MSNLILKLRIELYWKAILYLRFCGKHMLTRGVPCHAPSMIRNARCITKLGIRIARLEARLPQCLPHTLRRSS